MKELISGCIKCGNPLCSKSCPLGQHIPYIIKQIEQDHIDVCLETLYEFNPLPMLTGYFCSAYCQQGCVLNAKGTPYSFKALERELSLLPYTYIRKEENLIGKNISILGAGVSGLSAAILFSRAGASVKVFEKESSYLPTIFKLFPNIKYDKNLSDRLDSYVKSYNIDFKYNFEVGKDASIDDIKKQSDYVIIACGLDTSRPITLEGDGTYIYAKDFLYQINSGKSLDDYKGDFSIYGLGNVALDIAQYLTHFNRKVTLYYHKPRELSRLSKYDITKIDKYNLNVKFDTRVIKRENGSIWLENKGNINKIDNTNLILSIGNISSYNYLNMSNYSNNDIDNDYNILTKIDNLYIIGDPVSSKKDIPTAIETSFATFKDILQRG